MTDAGVPSLPPAAEVSTRRRTPKVAWRRKGGQLPRLDQLPIPPDVQPGKGWTGQMREMADHIGAYPTLCIVDAMGGEQVYISHSAEHSPFERAVDPKTCRTLARIYGGYRMTIPVAHAALKRARGAVVVAAVRAGTITGAEGAKVLGTSRSFMTHLANSPDEQSHALALPDARPASSQLDLFAALLDRPD